MLPTCDATRQLFSPLRRDIWESDRVEIRLNEKGNFLIDFYSIEGNYRSSCSCAMQEVIRRLPECKPLRADGSGMYSPYEIAATDCNVELINKLIPRCNLLFPTDLTEEGTSEELLKSQSCDEDNAKPDIEISDAELMFNNILQQSQLADDVARLLATYKETKHVPQHEFELCADAPLSPYQQIALIAQRCSPGFGLFMEQGTGKTPVVIASICNAAKEKRALQIANGEKPTMYVAIVVCPNQVRQNWCNEFGHFATQGGRITILRGTQIDRVKLLCDALMPSDGGDDECLYSIIICGYQTLWRSWETMKMLPFDLAVLDEAHAIKDIRAKQSQCCLELRDIAKQRICLTGTPVANSALDIYTLLEFMGKGESGFSTWDHFRKFYGVYDNASGHNILVGCQNLPFLQERLARKSFFISKKEAMPDLPDKVYDICEIEMTVEQADAYKTMATQLAFEIEADLNSNDGRNRQMMVTCILTKLLRLAQITSGFVSWSEQVSDNGEVLQPAFYEYFGENPKIEATLELLREKGPNDKTIIWACWIPDIEYLKSACEQNGIDCVTFTGSTNETERAEAIRRFNEDPNCKVFIGTAASGGSGLNLLGYPPNDGENYETNCNHIIYFSQNWSQIHRSQSEDRAHRRGTRCNVRITDLCVPGTIDEEIRCRVLGKKQHAMEVGDLRAIMQAIREI